jgi:DNA replication and repair protein RecF
VLTQRNKFLKAIADQSSPDLNMLDVYDEQLCDYGGDIFSKREDFVKQMIPVFGRFYSYVSSDSEEVSLEYQSQLLDGEFKNLLKKSRKKDRILQYTTTGIHRDDLDMKLGGYPLKKVGSQGQQKTYQLALKLGKFEFIRNVSTKIPILLLDDVFDKFDHKRVEQIVRLVSENDFRQIFITDTDEGHLSNILSQIGIENTVFRINDDKLIQKI